MGVTGLEPTTKPEGKTDIEPGALPNAPLSERADLRLKAVLEAWPNLPESLTTAIVQMVEESKHRTTCDR